MELFDLLKAGKYSNLTSSFSVVFLAGFLPITLLVYVLLPQKAKRYWLLIASYLFFWFISGELIYFILLATLSIHYFGLWLDRIQTQKKAALKATEKEQKKAVKKQYQHRMQGVMTLAVFVHIGALLVVKYSGFFLDNINLVLARIGISTAIAIPKFIMPIGISFFSLQALSYIFDVYRGATKADDNLTRLALWLTFFPQIVEGPFCRYGQTAEQLWNVKQVKYEDLVLGGQRILYGLLKKVVVADRLNTMVAGIFTDGATHEGGIIAIGAVCYTLQLYMDFSGSMDAVCGIGQIFGVTMPENFQRPFFSKTISEFWKRWHVTLGAWFRDYIFYPVSMAGPMKKLTMKARKKLGNHFGPLIAGSIALFCVWLANGLWHGSAWSYIFFGMYHFVLILCGNIIEPAVRWTNSKLHINPNWFPYRCFQIVRTSILVVIGELFFRAPGLRAGLAMFKKMVTDFHFTTLNADTLQTLSIDTKDIAIVLVTVVIVFVISVLNEKGHSVREWLWTHNIAIRWAVMLVMIMYIVIFGAYGVGYVPVDPMYANF